MAHVLLLQARSVDALLQFLGPAPSFWGRSDTLATFCGYFAGPVNSLIRTDRQAYAFCLSDWTVTNCGLLVNVALHTTTNVSRDQDPKGIRGTRKGNGGMTRQTARHAERLAWMETEVTKSDGTSMSDDEDVRQIATRYRRSGPTFFSGVEPVPDRDSKRDDRGPQYRTKQHAIDDPARLALR